MKKRHVLYLALAVFVGASLALLLYTAFFMRGPAETKVVYASFTLSEGKLVGIDLNGTALTFGSMPSGSSGRRYLILSNSYPYAVRLKTYSSGNISSHLSLSDYDFSLAPGEVKNLTITATAPTGPPAFYDRYVAFAFFKK